MKAPVDISQALKDTENSLRDFIASILAEKLGPNWIEECGASSDRVQKWKERKEIEVRRQQTGAVDERLIYYADFYDLQTILKKQWHHFSDALGDLKTFEVWLSELEKLRDPEAHRRELLPHQKYLALGIEGEIRTRIVRYRSKLETRDDYYPRIESIRDNYGTTYVPGQTRMVYGPTLRPGDKLEFVVTARDPQEEPLAYEFKSDLPSGRKRSLDTDWTADSSCSYVLQENDVGSMFTIRIAVRSPRRFHASEGYDDQVLLFYEVLPPKTSQ